MLNLEDRVDGLDSQFIFQLENSVEHCYGEVAIPKSSVKVFATVSLSKSSSSVVAISQISLAVLHFRRFCEFSELML